MSPKVTPYKNNLSSQKFSRVLRVHIRGHGSLFSFSGGCLLWLTPTIKHVSNPLTSRPIKCMAVKQGCGGIPPVNGFYSWHPGNGGSTSSHIFTLARTHFICTLGQTLGADISNCQGECCQTVHCRGTWLRVAGFVCVCVHVCVCVLTEYNACFQLPGANLYNNADFFLYIDIFPAHTLPKDYTPKQTHTHTHARTQAPPSSCPHI